MGARIRPRGLPEDGRIAWRDAAGAEYALRIFDVRRVLRAPETLSLRTTLATAQILEPDWIPEAD